MSRASVLGSPFNCRALEAARPKFEVAQIARQSKNRLSMRTFLHWLQVAYLLISCAAIEHSLLAAEGLPPDAHELKIGETAPDFSLRGVDGKMYSLANFKKAPVLMVVFLSNHCPYSHAAETRLLPLANEFKGKGLAVIAINPNSPERVGISELGYSKYNDSYEEIVLYA